MIRRLARGPAASANDRSRRLAPASPGRSPAYGGYSPLYQPLRLSFVSPPMPKGIGGHSTSFKCEVRARSGLAGKNRTCTRRRKRSGALGSARDDARDDARKDETKKVLTGRSPHPLSLLRCRGMAPAQGSVKPTVGFTFNLRGLRVALRHKCAPPLSAAVRSCNDALAKRNGPDRDGIEDRINRRRSKRAGFFDRGGNARDGRQRRVDCRTEFHHPG